MSVIHSFGSFSTPEIISLESLSGSWDAAAANIVLARSAAHVTLVSFPLVELCAASIAVTEGTLEHVSVGIAFAQLKHMTVCASGALDTEIEVAHLIARVATSYAGNREMLSARVADQGVASVDMDLACLISPLLCFPCWVKHQRVTVET